KGKQPVLQELGRLTQENGAVSEVKLLVAEEGYTITLDFVDEDGYLSFPSTKLFQKADWICGDE
ncbi:hypothetical protein, partial [Haloferula sp.]|uniref:hypothetical protein n=1 Tax=Haloferula sp. TaxID=2497595 RepID=UPI003C749182